MCVRGQQQLEARFFPSFLLSLSFSLSLFKPSACGFSCANQCLAPTYRILRRLSCDDVQVVMATNRIDILDPALLRPGRIDRKIEFPHPTLTSRMDIMGIHSRKMNLLRGIDLKVIAEKMPSASGAECKVRLRLG